MFLIGQLFYCHRGLDKFSLLYATFAHLSENSILNEKLLEPAYKKIPVFFIFYVSKNHGKTLSMVIDMLASTIFAVCLSEALLDIP